MNTSSICYFHSTHSIQSALYLGLVGTLLRFLWQCGMVPASHICVESNDYIQRYNQMHLLLQIRLLELILEFKSPNNLRTMELGSINHML